MCNGTRYTTHRSDMRSNTGWSLASAAFMIGILSGCGGGSESLGKDWHPVDFEPADLTAPNLVIDCDRQGTRFNGRLLGEEQILAAIRQSVQLVPRPLVFLRFSRNDKTVAYALAKEIA